MTATEIRLRLFRNGYQPLPLVGKNPKVNGEDWQLKRLQTNEDEIRLWETMWPVAGNTGNLARKTPCLDADLLDEDAARDVEDLVKERYEEAGYVLTRIGKSPKRAFPFRTDEPFKKITVAMIAPNGDESQKIEFLCDGQQFVVDGIHPDTGKPYVWVGKSIIEVPREELPYIRGEEAQALVDDIVAMLVAEHGYRRKEAPGSKGNGADEHHGGDEHHHGADWSKFGDLLDHDNVAAVALMLANAGMQAGAIYNLLRDRIGAVQTPDHERKQRRIEQLHNEVNTACGKAEKRSTEEQPQTLSPNEGKAFGYDWRLSWHGETDPTESRKELVAGLLPETGAALISGQWGTYKTFCGNDLAASVMTGTPFISFPVLRQGGVLWIACEGQAEVAIRITAAWEAKGGTGKAPFAWVEASPRLLDPNASKVLAAIAKQAAERMQREFALPLALVMIDTVGKAAAAAKTGDLNDDVVVKAIMKVLTEASAQTGALFVGIAHFGKCVETGTKGSSSFEDDADAVLALLGDKGINGTVESPRLCARKYRSGANGREFTFATKEVSIGDDETGRPITTLTLQWQEQADPAPKLKVKPDPWSAKSLRLLRQVLMNMLADCGTEQRPYPDGPLVRAIDLELARAEFYKSYPATGGEEAKKGARQKAFKRAIADAQAKGLIGVRELGSTTYVWLATMSAMSAGPVVEP
jgi:AAA domain/Bifunctional DNA primase/polymerase, N-terminal